MKLQKGDIIRLLSLTLGNAMSNVMFCTAYLDYLSLSCDETPLMRAVHAKSIFMMLTIAFLLFIGTGRNDVFFVISTLKERVHDFAVRRTWGADRWDVIKVTMKEGLWMSLSNLVLSVAMLLLFSGPLGGLMFDDSVALLTKETIWIIAASMAIMFVTSGVIPGFMYYKITVHPNGKVNVKDNLFRRKAILFIQTCVSFMLIEIVCVSFAEYLFLLDNPCLATFPIEPVGTFANHMLVGGVAVFCISVFGIVIHVRQEVSNRTKEIAIRRACGSTLIQIIFLVFGDILKLITPACVIGAFIGYFLIVYTFTGHMVIADIPMIQFLGIQIVMLCLMLLPALVHTYRLTRGAISEKLRNE